MPLFGASGSRIGYEVYEGPPDAPPLLLLHGFTASSACWVANVAGLSERFTVITADLLGHGGSDAPDDPALYAPAAAIARLEGLLDDLGYEQALVCGHSLGGALALRFALESPGRVAGLVVLNSNSAAGTPEWREGARVGISAMAAKARAEGTAFLKETRLYPAQGTRLPREARDLLTRDFERLTPAGFAGTAESLVIDVNAFERLGTLQVPTLVMIGDRDADFVQSAPRFIVRMPPDLVDTFTIEGAGHAANLEQPGLFNEALFAFAERIGYVSPGGAPSGAPLGLPGDAGSGTHAAGSAPAMVDREDDSGLGPTLYEDLGNTLRTRGRQISLTVAGFGLLAMGGALLVAAFFVGGDSDGGGNVAASDDRDPTATPTLVEQAAGVRTAAPNTPASQATSATAGAEPTTTPGASTTPTSAGGAVEPTATEGEPEPTPLVQATPTPASEPTASATATPSGPWVQVSGPTTAEVGEAVTFSASHSPDAIRLDWAASNGASAPIVPAFTVTFGTAGCHSVTVTALFPEGARASTQVVAVGVESCGLG